AIVSTLAATLILCACSDGSGQRAQATPTATSGACEGQSCTAQSDSRELKGHETLQLTFGGSAVQGGQGGTPPATPRPVQASLSNNGDASALIFTTSSPDGPFAVSSVTIRPASRARIRLVSSENVTCRVAADGSSATCDLLAPQVTVV